MDKNKLIIDRLKKMCRQRTKEIHRIYQIMQMTDRRKKI